MSDVPAIKITSAEDAWKYLSIATRGENLPDEFEIVFDGWPSLEMTFNGNDWNGTVPTRIMGPLLDVQKDIHKAFAMMSYGYPNLRKLTDQDRDALEIVVKVGEGSSKYNALLSKQLTEIAKQAIGKMESKHILIAILGIALSVSGTEVAKTQIAANLESEKSLEKVKLSQEETERMKVFAEAMSNSQVVRAAKENAEKTQEKVFRAVKPGDTLKIVDVELTAAEASEASRKERAQSVEKYITDSFKVLSNDASKSSGFRIKIQRSSDGSIFFADVPISIPEEAKQLIRDAEWSNGKTLVELDIKATITGGTVSRAVVFAASKRVN